MAKTTVKNWSREAVVALIEVYKNQPCLYDIKSAEYHNREKARDALAEMVKVVSQYYPSVTEEDCKRKYQSLRNQFCKEYAKVLASKGKSGSGVMDLLVYTPKLWCYDQLVFLKESLYQKRGTLIGSSQGNSELEGCVYFPDEKQENPVEYLEECEEDSETFLPAKIVYTPKTTVQKRKLEQAEYQEALSKRTLSESTGTKCPSPGSSRGSTPEAESLSSTLQTYLSKKIENRSEKISKNKYTAFGDFVGSWLNDNKNKKIRKQCMCDILNVITKYELEDSD